METFEYYNFTNNETETWEHFTDIPEPHASWFQEASEDPEGFVKVGDELYSIIH